ncbi:unnamed protein product [Tuber aestivum]|uniref:Uncharacterized protein n=1 Tax=Tuber aestivum TaxID=59557 RepID=A0A292Q2I2_9PEZI|nr:unnamed protein product [Tuber aestivum]
MSRKSKDVQMNVVDRDKQKFMCADENRNFWGERKEEWETGGLYILVDFADAELMWKITLSGGFRFKFEGQLMRGMLMVDVVSIALARLQFTRASARRGFREMGFMAGPRVTEVNNYSLWHPGVS